MFEKHLCLHDDGFQAREGIIPGYVHRTQFSKCVSLYVHSGFPV